MEPHAKLIAYTLRVAMDEFLHPCMTGELGGMIGLLPAVGARVQIDSNKHRGCNVATDSQQKLLKSPDTRVIEGRQRHGVRPSRWWRQNGGVGRRFVRPNAVVTLKSPGCHSGSARLSLRVVRVSSIPYKRISIIYRCPIVYQRAAGQALSKAEFRQIHSLSQRPGVRSLQSQVVTLALKLARSAAARTRRAL
ncbi:hypothetical protein BV20DRAFT_979717 [Pilatotrama ljubarskyi]|nr:hypothetical protein BV20DRAFT_979717 [Pilatotrama ljubarskyi]